MVTSLFKWERKKLISILEEELGLFPVGWAWEEALTHEPFLAG